MFYTGSGIPAGYGYFTLTTVAGENIVPALVAHLRSNDLYDTGAPISIGSISIQVTSDAQVSINGRAPILVQQATGLSFDVRGINSIVFATSGLSYNICVSY